MSIDDKQRIALIETQTVGAGALRKFRATLSTGQPSRIRKLGTRRGDGAYLLRGILPLWHLDFQVGPTGAELSLKRYRYTGKERDDENGFTYHGARYYAPWLARWSASDPAGLADGENLYAYVRNNPAVMMDPRGMDAKTFPNSQAETIVVDDPAIVEDPSFDYLDPGSYQPTGGGVVGSGSVTRVPEVVISAGDDDDYNEKLNLAAPVWLDAQAERETRYPRRLIDAAQAAQQKWGIPASVTLGQWAIESAYGQAMPEGSHNPFGIKASGNSALRSGGYLGRRPTGPLLVAGRTLSGIRLRC